ncbi:hypothetical protein BDQ17DRAFT_1338613 [Cyathus striatus]|nr:hypothetical protein BDQ17DRAFT_1338613 [Cyathus striatus]
MKGGDEMRTREEGDGDKGRREVDKEAGGRWDKEGGGDGKGEGGRWDKEGRRWGKEGGGAGCLVVYAILASGVINLEERGWRVVDDMPLLFSWMRMGKGGSWPLQEYTPRRTGRGEEEREKQRTLVVQGVQSVAGVGCKVNAGEKRAGAVVLGIYIPGAKAVHCHSLGIGCIVVKDIELVVTNKF